MYYILEMQTNGNTGAILPANTANTLNEALSIYYSKLAYAAMSEVQYHTCLIIDEKGQYIERKCCTHIVPKNTEE